MVVWVLGLVWHVCNAGLAWDMKARAMGPGEWRLGLWGLGNGGYRVGYGRLGLWGPAWDMEARTMGPAWDMEAYKSGTIIMEWSWT